MSGTTAIGEAAPAARPKRPFGVRLYLTFGFAAVALIAAGFSYVLLTGSSDQEASQRAADITVGRTVRLADRVGAHPLDHPDAHLDSVGDPGYSAWVFNAKRRLLSAPMSRGVVLHTVTDRPQAITAALHGTRAVDSLPGSVTVVSAPVFRNGRLAGALLVRADRPQAIARALDALRGDRLTAAGVALAIAVVIGFLIATAITSRLKRLAASAARITEGRLDDPLEGTGGRDEITELGTALETMRIALRETFGALSSERDRLSAIFDALDDAVMVVGQEGEVRFSNKSAASLIQPDGTVIDTLEPWLRRAALRGSAERDGLRVGDQVYAIGARRLPAENAVLAVVRNRTEALRREVAERVSRLTDSLLTLARIEAVGEGRVEALDVGIVVEEAGQAVAPPDGIEFKVEVEPDLGAEGDAVLLRQVLIGLLTNAFKNTPAPGVVTLRARSREASHVMIEVTDTGSGIASQEVDRVFERFYRGSGSLQQEGFGLGLSIAKRMIDVMGGQIGVESRVAVGSTFWVRLPAAKPAPTPVA